MKKILKQWHYDYLRSYLSREKEDIWAKFPKHMDNQTISVEVEEEIADEMHNWTIERQQKLGFDGDYRLNSEGKILEELIDIFYIS